ncbi:hypothetical protein RJT34_23844 [Clitoria ternatea]|uniref:WRC domain-containing protein n=1 Tax=Clitoria ternatea TaxID=43366 RepID=A0AAN9FLR9_CLITE
MRIRKRPVPFPFLPVSHSDPNLINRSPVMVQLNDATITTPKPSCTHGSATAPLSPLDPPQPSDQPLPPIGKSFSGCDDSFGQGGRQHKKQESSMKDGTWEEGGGHKGNDTRKGSTPSSAEPFSPPKQDGRWCEGEKAIPLKKRRGSIESVKEEDNNDDDIINSNKKNSKMKMKRKKSKKCWVQDDSSEGEEEEQEEVTKAEVRIGKKRVRGGALMEGSRCSRVNGRGWRCCQQTLVGYSLCEHHLGKGRLRSMTSVRNKCLGTTSVAPKKTPLSTNKGNISSVIIDDPLENGVEDDDEKKPLMVTKKRMKLGMVKARSISSLLGQTNQQSNVAMAAEDNSK